MLCARHNEGTKLSRCQRWNEKGFGFIERDNGRGRWGIPRLSFNVSLTHVPSVFCHASACPNRAPLIQGSKVSFVFESDDKGGKAKDVQVEEAATEAVDGPRETGTIKVLHYRRNPRSPTIRALAKLFLITELECRQRLRLHRSCIWRRRVSLEGGNEGGPTLTAISAFVHKRDCGGVDFVKGQAVSFVIGEGPKGAAAKEVRPEEGGEIEEATPDEEEGERQLGKVKVP